MSKKSKKNKLKTYRKLSANNIDFILSNKYDIEETNFWMWLFEGVPAETTTFLSMKNSDLLTYPSEHQQYLAFIKDEFFGDIDQDSLLEIENDIFKH